MMPDHWNALRRELNAMLDGIPARRKPFLRRSIEEDFLYSSDLPRVSNEAEISDFLAVVERTGWRGEQRGDFILLDFRITEPPMGWYAGSYGVEAACCASLLRRQIARGNVSQEGVQAVHRRLVKAGEQGDVILEQTCLALHREWAARLREKWAIPDVAISFFGDGK